MFSYAFLFFFGFFVFGCSFVGSTTLETLVEQTHLEQINNTFNYRIFNKKHRKNDKPWFNGALNLRQQIQCVRYGMCEKLTFNTCLGAKIPYEYTSLDLVDCQNQKYAVERLNSYRALRNVPKCWAVIQPLLCAVFVPKCEKINGEDMVYLPSLEMCRITMEPCKILYNTSFFPAFLRCNETLFPPKCNNDVREMKFNLTGKCIKPLVPAESSASYYPGIDGCGLQCRDPLYTDDEHRQIHKLIAWGGTLCFTANLFVVLTFLIDWKNANKYPALIVFYINLCFLMASFGWLAQFTPGSREDIVCRKDGTVRHSEPTNGENLSCVVVFVMIYYFLIAAMVWFVFLTYTWHLRAVGNVQDRINKKGSYFHLVAWSLPLVLTITTMALSEVDGNSIVGICFVGYNNQSMRAGLLLGPLFCVIIIGGYFIVRGMLMLFSLKNFANDIKSTSASNKIHLIIVRMAICAFFTLIFISVAILCNISEFQNSMDWSLSLKEYIICSISKEQENCKITRRPSVGILQLHLLCLFGSGITMSTWCWTPSSIGTWKRYIQKKFGKEPIEDAKMSKHKVIAHTWAKRKEFEDKGRLSITLYKTHTDPVGLNFDVNDLNSSETNEISSTWANYLPQFVKRRMALTGLATNSSSQDPRKNSIDSEISFSVRHVVSVESRRNSVDSQVSVKIAEMKTKVASRSRKGLHHEKHTSIDKRSQRRRDFISTAIGHKYGSRRESSTSIESQVVRAIKKSINPYISQKIGVQSHSSKEHHSCSALNKSMKTGNAENGMDLKNNYFMIPFMRNHMTSSTSEDISLHSFKNSKDGSDNDNDDNIKIDLHKELGNFKSVRNVKSLRNSTRMHHQRKYQTGVNINTRKLYRKVKKQKSTGATLDANNISNKLNKKLDFDFDNEYNCSSNLDMAMDVMLASSYSDISSSKMNSRNSKTSCDVGIQANAHDIARQTSVLSEEEVQLMIKNKSCYMSSDLTDATELQTLLQGKKSRDAIIMTESEKLKMLLLPSS